MHRNDRRILPSVCGRIGLRADRARRISWKRESPRDRCSGVLNEPLTIELWIPLGVGLLPIVVFLGGLVMLFPVAFAVAGGLGLAAWVFVKWLRKRKRAKSEKAIPTLVAEAPSPGLPATAPTPVEPIAVEPEPPPVRDKKPVCGILTWALPLVAVPVGILVGHVGDRFMDTEGFKGFGLMGLMFAPLFLALALSPVLATVSLCRRERFPGLGIAALIVPSLWRWRSRPQVWRCWHSWSPPALSGWRDGPPRNASGGAHCLR